MSRQAAITLVFDPSQHVLVMRRGPTDPWLPGHWNFPGGKVDPGESVRVAARRELAEETGILLSISTFNWAFSFRDAPGLVHVFWVKLNSRPPVPMPDGEHDRFEWVPTLHDIPQPSIPNVRFIVNQVTRHAGGGWNLAPLGQFSPSEWS